MRVSERALKQGEGCIAAWRRRSGQGEYGMRGRRGEVIYVERDLYLRS